MEYRFHRGSMPNVFVKNGKQLDKLENKYRNHALDKEQIPSAVKTTYRELAERIFPDRNGKEIGVTPLFFCESCHSLTYKAADIAHLTEKWLLEMRKEHDMDILSVAAGVASEQGCIIVQYLVRFYGAPFSDQELVSLFDFIGETEDDEEVKEEEREEAPVSAPEIENEVIMSLLDYPAESTNVVSIDEDSKEEASEKESLQLLAQREIYNEESDIPFLNRLEKYIPEVPVNHNDPVFELSKYQRRIRTLMPYDEFNSIYRRALSYLTGVEKAVYEGVMDRSVKKEVFDALMEKFIETQLIAKGLLPEEDKYQLVKQLNQSLFDLYIIQDLIDFGDEITDIKITAPDAVRVRIRGKAYLSDVAFMDDADYLRFVKSLQIRNRIDLSLPTQTFTDSRDDRYILRFTITAGYITESGYPIVHIRKISRRKMSGAELIKAGMFDERVMNYLKDCTQRSRGIIISAASGAGKTTLLNWLLEQYEDSAEILVIQENDELFSEKKGIMFQHVVRNPRSNEMPCSLEMLSDLGVVSGANVYIIGEARGAEVCSALTLANSGCRTALTVHASGGADETVDKLADLAMRGYADTFENARRSIKAFDTIVYLKDFHVQEITRIEGYDEASKKMIYKKIFDANA